MLQHRAGHRPGAEEHAREIEIENRLPVGGFHPHQQAIAGDPGVVDQHIDAAAFFKNGRHQLLHLLLLAHISLEGVGLATSCADGAHHLLGSIGRAGVVHHHFRAGLSQLQGDGTADAAAGACHQGDLAGQGCRGTHGLRTIVGDRTGALRL